jgi:hypothetical protein
MTQPANPFEVLRLDPTASEEEIVRQAGRLRQRSADETTLSAVRQAVQALTARPEARRLLALLTHPRPGYATADLDRLAAAHRRPPPIALPPTPCPPLDLAEVQAMLRARLVREVQPTPAPLEALPQTVDPAEAQREAEEAIWQSLLSDMKA